MSCAGISLAVAISHLDYIYEPNLPLDQYLYVCTHVLSFISPLRKSFTIKNYTGLSPGLLPHFYLSNLSASNSHHHREYKY
jgi:hypothetical protein